METKKSKSPKGGKRNMKSKSAKKPKSVSSVENLKPTKKPLKEDEDSDMSASASDLETSPTLSRKSSVTSLDKPKKKRNADKDDTWELAVKKARGLPDGANEGAEESDDDIKEKSNKGKEKAKKPLNTAADKIKKLAGKEDGKKGIKRKHSSGDDKGGDDKKKEDDGITRKERKKQRRMMKNNYEVASKAKSIWEQVRRTDTNKEKRHELCTELYGLVKGKGKELIFAHDTSRVVQCLLKYGLPEHKNALFEELREHIVEMAKSKYAKFFVRKLLKYGTKAQRNYVFRSLYGNVRKLVRHKEAAEIVECAYNDFANVSQRAALVEEFYGPSFALFKTPEIRTIDNVMKASPEKRDSILSNMKEALSVLVEKTVCQYSIVHRVFLEYFTYAPEKQRNEMIETVRESLIHMVHTRDGAHVAMKCLWFGTAKDRKVIIKSMKTYVVKVCKEDYGHLVLLALFDVVDDTKLVSKAILEEMVKSLSDVMTDQHGRKVILYLLSPRDPLHFCPDIVKVLEQGDNNLTSKKDPAVRRGELLQVVSGPLLRYIAEHTREIVMNSAAILPLMTILTHVKEDPSEAMRAVCKVAGEPFVAGSLENFHMVEHPAGHITLKRLILNDQQRVKDGKDVLFSKLLLETLEEGRLKSWAACNRGCFTLVTLLEVGDEFVTKEVKKQLEPVTKSLSKMDFKGAQILAGKLNV